MDAPACIHPGFEHSRDGAATAFPIAAWDLPVYSLLLEPVGLLIP